ncbi:uncharacterized protein LOC134261258, partial [Saccostrea cucullata]|uniref:uncharacterized protein LOC134261258 n=1 Tax=Saccostrea cuccullata TaxID=36930 RepID=UPI002ED3BEED
LFNFLFNFFSILSDETIRVLEGILRPDVQNYLRILLHHIELCKARASCGDFQPRSQDKLDNWNDTHQTSSIAHHDFTAEYWQNLDFIPSMPSSTLAAADHGQMYRNINLSHTITHETLTDSPSNLPAPPSTLPAPPTTQSAP